MDGPKLHSIWEVADILGVGPSSVQKYIESGALKAVRVKVPLAVKRVWHCSDDDIKAFRERQEAKKRIKKRADDFGKDLL